MKKQLVVLGVIIALSLCHQALAAEDYRGIKLTAKDGEVLQPFERSWAVIIGIDDYQHIGKLKFAVSDAKAVKRLLQDKYGFAADNIVDLYNAQATREKILSVLGDELPHKIGERDRLMVYFAGHGETYLNNGYLIPVDYRQGKYRSSAVSMTELKDILKDIKAKHIYLVLDACYSGMFFTQRAVVVEKTHPRYLREITRRKAKQALTAGGKEPVSDSGYQNHSAFTGIFLEALDTGYADYNGDGIITASEINAYIQPKVAEIADQTPEFGSLPGSEGGEFVFIMPRDIGDLLSNLKRQNKMLKEKNKKLFEQVERLKQDKELLEWEKNQAEEQKESTKTLPMRIMGVITDMNNRPVEGVFIKTDPHTQIVATDSQGHYSIIVQKKGVYSLTAHKEGYISTEPATFLIEEGNVKVDIKLSNKKKKKWWEK